MWAIGRYDLGLSDKELQDIMPVQFAALVERWVFSRDLADYRAAMITAAIYNTVRDPKKKSTPFVPEDFLKGKTGAQTDLKPTQTPKQMKRVFMMWGAALSGSK